MNKNCRRTMFTKGGGLKKSASLEIISTNTLKPSITSPINSPRERFRAPDLGFDIEIEKEEKLLLTKPVSIKNIITGELKTVRIERSLATYSKININYSVEWSVDKSKVSFLEFKDKYIVLVNELRAEKKLSFDQHLVLTKRLNGLDLSYVHTVMMDTIEEDNEYITIIYHVITTKDKEVDLGGPNIFTPLFLCHDVIKGKDFYSIPLTYKHKLKKVDYLSYFLPKKKESLKKDSIELQEKLAKTLKIWNDSVKFKLFDVNKDCLDLAPTEVNPKQEFPLSTYAESITNWIESIKH